MNHLAHAWLAAPDADVMFGSLIADFLRGAIDPALPRGVRIGIALHRAVDAYTDAHPEVAAARALFEPPYRRYAGILLDVWFDHLLARDWSRHGSGSLQAFSRSVQDLLDLRSAELPPRMHGFARYLRAHDLPGRYREIPMIEDVLRGLSQRLSRANPLAGALPVIEARAAPLDRHFDAFFPDLIEHAVRERGRLAATLPG
ncbi:ACP phosphodiesterase [Dokdonella soli]|uniref:ACP phosphodiesterase n=1 Tax=Dokdonella soli TaxID=529810 RepID=A0ABN1IFI3_9GAMM